MMYILALILSFFLSAIATPVVILISRRLRILDFPDSSKKLHGAPIPLLGGFAVFFSFCLTLIFLLQRNYIIDSVIQPRFIIGILLSGCILMVGGYLDDKYRLTPLRQFFFPLLATGVTLSTGIYIKFITHPSGGVLHIPLFFGIAATALWLLGMMYTTKFLDGLDGLAGGVSIIAALVIFFVSLFWDVRQSGTSYIALIVAGASAGFLLYNFHPAKIFLGEGGSVFLGYIIGVLSIISGSKIATAVLVFGLPIIDTAWVIYQRFRQKISPSIGDRRHFHFSLLDSGVPQRKVVLFIYFTTLLFGTSSIFLHTKGKIFSLTILVIVSLWVIKKFYIDKKKTD